VSTSKRSNLIRRDFDVTACRVTEVKPGDLANNLPTLVPDRISVAQDGEIGGCARATAATRNTTDWRDRGTGSTRFQRFKVSTIKILKTLKDSAPLKFVKP